MPPKPNAVPGEWLLLPGPGAVHAASGAGHRLQLPPLHTKPRSEQFCPSSIGDPVAVPFAQVKVWQAVSSGTSALLLVDVTVPSGPQAGVLQSRVLSSGTSLTLTV